MTAALRSHLKTIPGEKDATGELRPQVRYVILVKQFVRDLIFTVEQCTHGSHHGLTEERKRVHLDASVQGIVDCTHALGQGLGV